MGEQVGVEVWDCWVGVGEVGDGYEDEDGEYVTVMVVRALQVDEREEEG
jgi:hypothetical protein